MGGEGKESSGMSVEEAVRTMKTTTTIVNGRSCMYYLITGIRGRLAFKFRGGTIQRGGHMQDRSDMKIKMGQAVCAVRKQYESRQLM